MPTDPTLAVTLAGLSLRNPVILAAGTAGYLDEMAGAMDLSRIGAVVTKSITRLARDGNATWRIVESRAGMLNAIGLANVGLDRFIQHMAPRAGQVPTAVIGSVAGFSSDDYVTAAGAMDDVDAIAAIELNVSCPNVRGTGGGAEFGANPRALAELIAAVRPAVTRAPLIVKLSPIIGLSGSGILEVARAAIEPAGSQPAGSNSRPGADILTVANTVPAMAIDVHTRRPRLANITGGLSGPGIHPIAVKLVHDVYRALAKSTGTPIIGAGGVLTWHDAAEFILAGASAIQMGTALFIDPRSPARVARALAKWTRDQGRASISDLVGALET